jgi:hypothetical protein
MVCELQPTQAQGRRAEGDQSPKAGGNSGVEREFDLAKETEGPAFVKVVRTWRRNRDGRDVAVGG